MNRKFYEVEVIQAGDDALYLRVDGQVVQIAWIDCSASLADASAIEREIIDVAPSGYGLHWPLLDEDLALAPLLLHGKNVEIEMSGLAA